MTTSMIANMTHDIRLERQGGLCQGSCSCGWASAGSTSTSDAAGAAIGHSISCGGPALMAGPKI